MEEFANSITTGESLYQNIPYEILLDCTSVIYETVAKSVEEQRKKLVQIADRTMHQQRNIGTFSGRNYIWFNFIDLTAASAEKLP